jgi:uncharacterized protein (UPF0548 family)
MIASKIESAARAGLMHPEYLRVDSGLLNGVPPRCVHDRLRTQIGEDERDFEAAIRCFESWTNFDLEWVRVANSSERIELGHIVAVEVQSLGLWSLNLSQIVEVLRRKNCFGYLYKTTAHHVERGEERFLLTYEPATRAVWYETQAISRPNSLLAQIGYPVTRAFQHRFARASHKRMREAVAQDALV